MLSVVQVFVFHWSKSILYVSESGLREVFQLYMSRLISRSISVCGVQSGR